MLHCGDLFGILAEAVQQLKPNAIALRSKCVAVSQTAEYAEARFAEQGAVMAIEDAYVVAACLSKYANEPLAAFERYQDVRRDRTAAVVRKAHEN
jgi:hypothetical protein